ncbi:MAG: enoyl-CoA hydratase/isomerase family protein [Actinomycetota bacterium]|nr:enoyl-CoA hydratase/isomerase family protein [Actinomycetota bacterium]
MTTRSRFGDVTVTADVDHVATVVVDRAPNNYFDTALIADLAAALETVDADPSCRAVVLASEGKHFCAGAALDKRDASNGNRGRHLYDEAQRIFATGLPIVAAVQGAAIGGGLGLALAADFRIGATESRFSANFAKLGFHHGFGTTVTLPTVVGPQRAAELLLTGARIGGEEALSIGLIDRLVPLPDVRTAAHQMAAEIASCAPLATRSIRATLRADLVDRIREATDHEKAEQDRLSKTRDFAEGVQAMAERRPPRFEGR